MERQPKIATLRAGEAALVVEPSVQLQLFNEFLLSRVAPFTMAEAVNPLSYRNRKTR